MNVCQSIMLNASAVVDITVLHKTRKIIIEPDHQDSGPDRRFVACRVIFNYFICLSNACFLTETFGNGRLYFYVERYMERS